MSYWGDIARALEDVDPRLPSRAAAAALWKAVAADDVEGGGCGERARPGGGGGLHR